MSTQNLKYDPTTGKFYGGTYDPTTGNFREQIKSPAPTGTVITPQNTPTDNQQPAQYTPKSSGGGSSSTKKTTAPTATTTTTTQQVTATAPDYSA